MRRTAPPARPPLPTRVHLRCAKCGYGVVVTSPPPRCPMCGAASWVQAPAVRRP